MDPFVRDFSNEWPEGLARARYWGTIQCTQKIVHYVT